MLASDRFAGVLLALLVIGLAGAYSPEWRPRYKETCADREALLDPASIPDASGLERARHRGMRLRIDGYVMPERRGEGRPLPFTVRRTLEQPEWLMRPTRAVPGPSEPNRIDRREFEIDGQLIPVTFAYELGRSHARFAAYIFAYDGQAVRHPFWTRLLDAPRALFGGPRPITYIGISGAGHPKELGKSEERAEAWLKATWRHYKSSCGP
jgi:hypothetical protein